MAKPASNHTQISRLESARVRATGLPRGKALKSTDMAQLIGVSWVSLRDWCDSVPGFEASGAFVRGGNGVEWKFKPVKTIDFLTRYFKRQQSEASKRQNRVREIIGGTALAGVPEHYSLDDLSKMIALSIRLQEQMERQGKLIDADKVRSLVTELFSTMQQAALRAAMEQDPSGMWPGEIRDSFENAMRNVLSTMERAARDCLKALTAGG